MKNETACQRTWTEPERLRALERYAILDTPPEPTFDGIVRLAADLCETPVALLSLITSERQWFKAEVGLGIRETQISASVCALLLSQPGVTVFPDLTADERTAGNPLVTAAPNLRFYAGALLETPDGFPIGSLCVLDFEPRPEGLTERQRRGLATLGDLAMESLEFRRMQLELAEDERRASAKRIRESEARYRAIFEQAAVGIARRDSNHRFEAVNKRFCEITGYPADELIGRTFKDITHPDDLPRELAEVDRLTAGEISKYAIDKRYIRRDGSIVWVRLTVNAVYEAPGAPPCYISVIEDVTERIRAQERENLLLAELQHRVRNTLAVVRGIAKRTAESSDTVEDFAMHLEGRLAAFARTQAYVTRSPGKGIDLTNLVIEELAAHGAREGDQFRIFGPELSLLPDAADKIGLAVHELASNAVKHGALDVRDGYIDISWRIEPVDGVPMLVLDWFENVPEGGIAKPDYAGFGMQLLERTLSHEFDAETHLDFTPHGLKCTIRLPLANVA